MTNYPMLQDQQRGWQVLETGRLQCVPDVAIGRGRWRMGVAHRGCSKSCQVCSKSTFVNRWWCVFPQYPISWKRHSHNNIPDTRAYIFNYFILFFWYHCKSFVCENLVGKKNTQYLFWDIHNHTYIHTCKPTSNSTSCWSWCDLTTPQFSWVQLAFSILVTVELSGNPARNSAATFFSADRDTAVCLSGRWTEWGRSFDQCWR